MVGGLLTEQVPTRTRILTSRPHSRQTPAFLARVFIMVGSSCNLFTFPVSVCGGVVW
jgi:hypothetical protein